MLLTHFREHSNLSLCINAPFDDTIHYNYPYPSIYIYVISSLTIPVIQGNRCGKVAIEKLLKIDNGRLRIIYCFCYAPIFSSIKRTSVLEGSAILPVCHP